MGANVELNCDGGYDDFELWWAHRANDLLVMSSCNCLLINNLLSNCLYTCPTLGAKMFKAESVFCAA